MKSEPIKVFAFSKKRINLNYIAKDQINRRKNTSSLMPNLIHSLDATSMILLFDKFSKLYTYSGNFYSVHDCFATTCEKVPSLMTLLRNVYAVLYIENQYLRQFDKYINNNIKGFYGDEVFINEEETEIGHEDTIYKIYNAD